MATRAGGPGAFAEFDLSRVPSPCFVVDKAAIEANLRVLADVGQRGGAKVLLALKAFSMWALGDLVSEHLDGAATSGLWEARLAASISGARSRPSAPATRRPTCPRSLALSDHVIFNTPARRGASAPRWMRRGRRASASISACASIRCTRKARSPYTIPPSRTAGSAIPPTS